MEVIVALAIIFVPFILLILVILGIKYQSSAVDAEFGDDGWGGDGGGDGGGD